MFPLRNVTISGSKGQVIRYVGSVTTRMHPSLGQRHNPGQPSGGEPDPGQRIHLNHVRRCAPGVAWTGNALDCTMRWDAYLHRPARSTPGQIGQQGADGIT